MNTNIKILISDYDQTFYLNDKDIEENKKKVEEFRKKGNIFVVATGRSYIDFKNMVDKYKFSYDYVLINHGATILDKDDNIFYNFSIKNEIVPSIKKDLKLDKLNILHCFCCSKLESRVDFEHKDLTKIAVKYKEKENAIKINEDINNEYSNFVNSYHVSENRIEIVSKEIDKAKAIELLLQKLEITENDIHVIGDGYTDIQMIKKYNGYAVKNAVEELKQVAKKQYNSVSELIDEIMN